MNVRIAFLMIALAVAGFIRPLMAQPVQPTFNDVIIGNVPLDAGGNYTLRTDIYAATAGAGPRPVLVWIHGGGWSGGTYNNVPAMALALRSRGITVASADYRLSQQAIFPAQIHDVKGLVRFLRANAATFNIDSERIGAWGTSAGGHLTALLGTSGDVPAAEGVSGGNPAFSSRIQAAVDFFGPTDLLMMNLDVTTPPGSAIDHDAPGSPESRLIGFDDPGQGIGVLRANMDNPNPPFPEKAALVTLANPNVHASADDPPFYIAHGTNDTAVPLFQSQRLFDALSPHIDDAAFQTIPGAGHGPLGTAVELAAREFLVMRLLPRSPGDANCDGAFDAGDVAPLVQVLVSPLEYSQALPACNPANADMNGDFLVNGDDISLFVDELLFN